MNLIHATDSIGYDTLRNASYFGISSGDVCAYMSLLTS